MTSREPELESVLKSVVGGEFSSADDVAVLHGRELVGLVAIECRR